MSCAGRISARSAEGRSLVLFDLDFTLVPHDTMLLFCNYVLRKERRRLAYALVFLPAAVPAALRLISSGTIKRFFFSFLWRLPEERVRDWAQDYVRTWVVPEVFPELRERIEEHRRRGDYLILNTASPFFYAELIARELGFDACCATDMAIEARQRLLPRIRNRNNKHAVKLDCMLPLLPTSLHETVRRRRDYELKTEGEEPEPLAHSMAYSDSTADLPLLRLAERGVVVAPGNALALLARARGWETIVPKRPYSNRPGKIRLMLKEALGLYHPS